MQTTPSKSRSYILAPQLSLEKEITLALSQCEEERRQELILDSSIKGLEQELEKLRAQKNEEFFSYLEQKYQSLQRKLEVAQTIVNTTQNENLLIRNKIDHLRIVTASYKNKIRSLEVDIEATQSKIKQKNLEQDKEKVQENDKIGELRLVMSKSANEKLRYTQKLEAISGMIRKEQFSNTSTIRKTQENLDNLFSRDLKALNSSRLIESLLKKSANDVKKTAYKITRKKQQVHKLQDLFNNVKSSGVETEEEFVDGFLKSYDQSNSLSKYQLEILAEIESFEFANKRIDAHLEESTKFWVTTSSKASSVYNEMNGNIKKTYGKINSAMRHNNTIRNQMENVKSWLDKMAILKRNWEAHSSHNEECNLTIEELLATTEEFIQSIKVVDLHNKKIELSIKNITLSPIRIRESTPEFNQASLHIREFLTSRDLVEDTMTDDDKTPTPLEILRERAKILMDFPNKDRTKTPPPRIAK